MLSTKKVTDSHPVGCSVFSLTWSLTVHVVGSLAFLPVIAGHLFAAGLVIIQVHCTIWKEND